MEAFFQRLAGAGSREGCFIDPLAQRVEATLVCHDVRNISLARGERTWISCRIVGAQDREQFAGLGEAVTLKLEFDNTIVLRTWASVEELPVNNFAERRACGELRIPVHRLVTHCNYCLYQTWLLLDSPGLNDTVASIRAGSGSDSGEAFDQALHNGPRQLLEPKACLSIVKTASVPAAGSMNLTEDVPDKERVQLWNSLLRSQQQHVLMCHAQFLQQNTRPNAGVSEQSALKELSSLQDQLRDTTASLEAERIKHSIAIEKQTAFFQQMNQRDMQRTREVDELNATVRELREKGATAATAQVADQQNKLLLQEKEMLREELERLRAQREASSEEQGKLQDKLKGLETVVHEKQLELAKQKDVLRNTEARLKIEGTREWETKDAQRRAEIERLQAKVESLEAGGEAAAALQVTCDGHVRELASMLEANKRLQLELDITRSERSNCDEASSKSLSAANRQIEELQNDKEIAQQKIERLVSENQELRSNLEGERKNAAKIEILSAENAEFRATMVENHTTLRKVDLLIAKNAELQASLDAERERVRKVEDLRHADMRELETTRSQSTSEIERLKAATKEYQNALIKVDSLNAENAELRGKLVEEEGALRKVERLVAENAELRSSLEAERDRVRKASELRSADMQELENTRSHSSAEIERLRAVTRDHQNALLKVNSLSVENSDLRIQLVEERERARAATDQRNADVHELEVTRLQTSSEIQRLKALTKDHDDALIKISGLAAECSELRAKLEEEREKARKAGDLRDADMRELEVTRSQNSMEIERLKAVATDHENAVLKMKRLATENDDLKASLGVERERARKFEDMRSAGLRELEHTRSESFMEIERLKAEIIHLQSEAEASSVLQITCDSQAHELSTLRANDERQRAEIANLQRELDKICDEGKFEMGAASDAVRAIQKGHEDALLEINILKAEREKLTEEKEQLAKIVEDLHQSLVDAGMPGVPEAGRQSIERLSLEGLFSKGAFS